MKLHVINSGFFKLDGGAMFGVVPRSMWEKLNPPDSKGLCTWAMRCLLIEDGNKLILIDCGMGDKQEAKFFSHYEPSGETLSTSLKAEGFNEDDITDVLLTHLHFDHCGGAVKREGEKLSPAFKNATYWSNDAHWDWAVNPNPREKASFLKENILPIQESGQLRMLPVTGNDKTDDMIRLNEIDFAEGFSIRIVNGHTNSMMLPQLTYKGKLLYLWPTCYLPPHTCRFLM